MAEIVSDTNFDDIVLKSDKPVVVDFFAEWCGPCKAMAPALSELATDMKDSVTVVKIDVDKSPQTAHKYNIRAMPTLLIFKDGEVAAQHTGAITQKTALAKWVNGNLEA